MLGAEGAVTAETSKLVPWLRLPRLPKIPSGEVSEAQDKRLTQKLRETASTSHKLVLKPNAWMKCFGITDDESVREINNRITERIAFVEKECAEVRKKEG